MSAGQLLGGNLQAFQDLARTMYEEFSRKLNRQSSHLEKLLTDGYLSEFSNQQGVLVRRNQWDAAASFVDAAAGAMAGKAKVYSGQQQRYINETLMESEDALEKAFHSFTTLGFRDDGTRSL